MAYIQSNMCGTGCGEAEKGYGYKKIARHNSGIGITFRQTHTYFNTHHSYYVYIIPNTSHNLHSIHIRNSFPLQSSIIQPKIAFRIPKSVWSILRQAQSRLKAQVLNRQLAVSGRWEMGERGSKRMKGSISQCDLMEIKWENSENCVSQESIVCIYITANSLVSQLYPIITRLPPSPLFLSSIVLNLNVTSRG